MRLLDVALSDIYLLLSVLAFIGLYLVIDTPLSDGYHVRHVRSPLRWEETWIFFGVALLFYPLVFVGNMALVIWPFSSIEFSTFQLTYIIGILYAGFLGPLWVRTLQKANGRKIQLIRSGGIFASAVLGMGLGGAVVIGTHPSMDTLDALLGYYITVSFSFIEQHQAILGLSIPVLESPLRDLQETLAPALSFTWDIYLNNLKIALFGGSIALIGGLAGGLLIPLVMIGGAKIGLILAAYLGLFIRYSIAAGNPMFGPIIAFGAAISIHTIPEILATVYGETGMGLAGMAPMKGADRAILGLKVAVFGLVGFLGFAAFLEVFLSPLVAEPLIGYITVQGEIVPLSVGSDYFVGVASTLVAFVIFGALSVWGIRNTVDVMEEIL